MIVDLEQKVTQLYNTPSDINEHLPTIIKYGQQCDHITEMGSRGLVSIWAWLASVPDKLVSYDIQHPSNWGGSLQDLEDTATALGVNFEFNLANVLEVVIEETDILFIDTWHAYKQLKAELALHSSKVRKYICFHDTTSFATVDEKSYEAWGDAWKGSGIGIWKAIEEFLEDNPQWTMVERYTNNNGFTIIKRVGEWQTESTK